jgi:hypothetical protein
MNGRVLAMRMVELWERRVRSEGGYIIRVWYRYCTNKPYIPESGEGV